MGAGEAMRAWRWLGTIAAWGALACGGPEPRPAEYLFVDQDGLGEDPSVTVLATGIDDYTDGAWDVVRWPSMETVPATVPDFVFDDGRWTMAIDVHEELTESWYAVRYVGAELPISGLGQEGLVLADGSRVWRFIGYRPPVVGLVTVQPVAETGSEPLGVLDDLTVMTFGLVRPAVDGEWSSTLRVMQDGVSCSDAIAAGEPTTFVTVTCEGFDWSRPVRVEVSGLVSPSPDGSALPTLVLDDVLAAPDPATPYLQLRLHDGSPPTPPAPLASMCPTVPDVCGP